MKENTAQVRAILPIEIASFLLNEKRQAIIDIEVRQKVAVIIIPNQHFTTPQYEVERIRTSDFSERDEKLASYQFIVKPEIETTVTTQVMQRSHQEPAIKSMSIDQLIPLQTPLAATTATSKEKMQKGFLKRFVNYLFEKKEGDSLEGETESSGKRRYETQPQRNKYRSHHRNRNGKRPGQRYDQNRQRHARLSEHHRSKQETRPIETTLDQQSQETKQLMRGETAVAPVYQPANHLAAIADNANPTTFTTNTPPSIPVEHITSLVY